MAAQYNVNAPSFIPGSYKSNLLVRQSYSSIVRNDQTLSLRNSQSAINTLTSFVNNLHINRDQSVGNNHSNIKSPTSSPEHLHGSLRYDSSSPRSPSSPISPIRTVVSPIPCALTKTDNEITYRVTNVSGDFHVLIHQLLEIPIVETILNCKGKITGGAVREAIFISGLDLLTTEKLDMYKQYLVENDLDMMVPRKIFNQINKLFDPSQVRYDPGKEPIITKNTYPDSDQESINMIVTDDDIRIDISFTDNTNQIPDFIANSLSIKMNSTLVLVSNISNISAIIKNIRDLKLDFSPQIMCKVDNLDPGQNLKLLYRGAKMQSRGWKLTNKSFFLKVFDNASSTIQYTKNNTTAYFKDLNTGDLIPVTYMHLVSTVIWNLLKTCGFVYSAIKGLSFSGQRAALILSICHRDNDLWASLMKGKEKEFIDLSLLTAAQCGNEQIVVDIYNKYGNKVSRSQYMTLTILAVFFDNNNITTFIHDKGFVMKHDEAKLINRFISLSDHQINILYSHYMDIIRK